MQDADSAQAETAQTDTGQTDTGQTETAQADTGQIPEMGFVFEYVTHQVQGETLTFVLNRESPDWFSQKLRQTAVPNAVLGHLQALARICAASGTALPRYADFGANVGVSALYPARLGFPTLAVEAGARNIALLTEAVAINDLAPLCRPCLMAAGAGRGVVPFHEYSAWGWLELPDRPLASAGQVVAVRDRPGALRISLMPTDTVAGILTQQGFADAACIKIDIEGSEMAALTGFEAIAARPTLRDLIVESNGAECANLGYPVQVLWARLIELGFALYMILGRRLAPAGPDTPQPRLVMDMLATRRDPAELTGGFGYRIAAFSPTELTEMFATLESQNPAVGVPAFAAQQKALMVAASPSTTTQ